MDIDLKKNLLYIDKFLSETQVSILSEIWQEIAENTIGKNW